MTQDGFHRIDEETAVAQDAGGKVGDLHRVAVALFQEPEGIGGIGQEQFAQRFPVV